MLWRARLGPDGPADVAEEPPPLGRVGDVIAHRGQPLERVEVVIHDGATGALLWSSGVIGERVAEHDSLRVADIDEDGFLETVVNLGVVGINVGAAASSVRPPG